MRIPSAAAGYWIGFIILALLIVAIATVAAVRQASSHDWYTGQQNIHGGSCCDGEGAYVDCGHILSGNVEEVAGGYIVTLTKEEMKRIKPKIGGEHVAMSENGFSYGESPNMVFKKLKWGIREFVSYAESLPAADGNYSVCLRNYPEQSGNSGPLHWILCFFRPSNT